MRVQEGDVVLLRAVAGAQHELRPIMAGTEPPQEHSGFHAATLPWLHERGVAVVGSDVTTDTRFRDEHYTRTRMPVHQVALVAMGLRLIDNRAPGAPRGSLRGAQPLGVLLHAQPAALRARHSAPRRNPIATF